ncbi:MAG: GNAT family N-acetyltransferase [Chitinivibrionales bacterium]|nr:GNAT family N-acetyltransferase [Chitinivibrionales bacterium]
MNSHRESGGISRVPGYPADPTKRNDSCIRYSSDPSPADVLVGIEGRGGWSMRIFTAPARPPLYTFGDFHIRHLRMSDAHALAHHGDNPRIRRHLPDSFPSPYRVRDAKRFIAEMTKAPTAAAFTVASRDEAIGCVVLKAGRDINRLSAEIGYWLGEPFWRQGIMSAAVTFVTRFAFAELGFVRLYGTPFASNAVSVRVLENAGYRIEGIMRASALKDELIRDQMLLARVAAPFDYFVS